MAECPKHCQKKYLWEQPSIFSYFLCLILWVLELWIYSCSFPLLSKLQSPISGWSAYFFSPLLTWIVLVSLLLFDSPSLAHLLLCDMVFLMQLFCFHSLAPSFHPVHSHITALRHCYIFISPSFSISYLASLHCSSICALAYLFSLHLFYFFPLCCSLLVVKFFSLFLAISVSVLCISSGCISFYSFYSLLPDYLTLPVSLDWYVELMKTT